MNPLRVKIFAPEMKNLWDCVTVTLTLTFIEQVSIEVCKVHHLRP